MRVLPLLAVFTVGVFLYKQALPPALETGWVASSKLVGKAPGCPWSRVLSLHWDLKRFHKANQATQAELSILAHDGELELVAAPRRRSFWVRKHGTGKPGKELIAYLVAEQDWVATSYPSATVRQGDVVLDCGAHVGVFTSKALELGAAQVIAIEPDPVNRECLLRNFPREIASGRVVVVPKGVWSSQKDLTFYVGMDNSGMGGVVRPQGGATLQIPVTTIDLLAQELNLRKIDYIKMDIEGAEREALKGAEGTLRARRPRLMLDSYHEPDDIDVLPAIIRAANPLYRITCGACQPEGPGSNTFVPHTVFFE